LHDLKALASPGDDVHAPILILLDYVEYLRGAANLGNLAIFGAQHAKRPFALQTLSNHLFIARLENVQWQRRARKQNRIQWKQRQQSTQAQPPELIASLPASIPGLYASGKGCFVQQTFLAVS
jgi:hypothetical protein